MGLPLKVLLSVLVAFLLTGGSCSSQDKCTPKLEDFRAQFPALNANKDWQLYLCHIHAEGRVANIELLRSSGDTTFVADMYQSDNSNDLAQSVYRLEFVKKYPVGDEYHWVHYDQNYRLQYHRKEVPGISGFVFIVGKYAFQYLMGGLNPRQRLFYEMHRDSLRNVKGDALPPLPER